MLYIIYIYIYFNLVKLNTLLYISYFFFLHILFVCKVIAIGHTSAPRHRNGTHDSNESESFMRKMSFVVLPIINTVSTKSTVCHFCPLYRAKPISNPEFCHTSLWDLCKGSLTHWLHAGNEKKKLQVYEN